MCDRTHMLEMLIDNLTNNKRHKIQFAELVFIIFTRVVENNEAIVSIKMISWRKKEDRR